MSLVVCYLVLGLGPGNIDPEYKSSIKQVVEDKISSRLAGVYVKGMRTGQLFALSRH